MDALFAAKGQIQKFYGSYSKYIDKAFQFLLALASFYMINHSVGFAKMFANPLITLGLAVVCTFLPLIGTVFFAALLILVHLFAASLGAGLVTAAVFLVMFIFYFKFTPKKSALLLLTPLAFAFKIPYAVPVACGLLGSPSYAAALTCSVALWYMLLYLKTSLAALKGAGGLMNQMTVYAGQIFSNKEMWVMALAFAICLLTVYYVRKMAASYAWQIAITAGVLANLVVVAAGDMLFGVKVAYPDLFLGNGGALAAGGIIEFLFFAVDYSRSELLQYEDDEYYYYVKAIPKITVPAAKKTIKRINKREEKRETEILDTEAVRKRTVKKRGDMKERGEKNRGTIKHTEQILLTQSLRKDLKLDDIK